jgi:hypothetical protein
LNAVLLFTNTGHLDRRLSRIVRRRAPEMIDPASGVEAFLKPRASELPYQEYAVPPGSVLYVDGRNTGYIEAITNERYSMGVTLPMDFHTVSNAAVRITFTLHISDLERITISEAKPVVGLAAGPLTFEVDTFTATYPGSFGYGAFGFRFVDQGICTHLHEQRALLLSTCVGYSISEHEDAEDVKTRSRIDVEIVRGQLKLTHLAKPIRLSDRAWATPTTETLALDHGRSHTVGFVNVCSSCAQHHC